VTLNVSDAAPEVDTPAPNLPPINPAAKRIVCFRGDRAACHAFRIFFPFGKLAQRHKDDYTVFVSSAITQDHLKEKYDLILLQRQYKEEVLRPILEMKKKGPKIVYEIDDDLFNIPDWNPAKRILGVKAVQEGIRKFLGIVDAVFVSTEYLVDIYKPYCKKVYVLPNSINYDFVYARPQNALKKVVLWQGSMTHYKDVAIAEKGILALAKNPDILVKMWCGFDPKTYKPVFDFPGAHVIPLVPFEAFYAMFSQVDAHIGLAPLSTVPFNKSKSNLKFLEYTVQGMVTVASDFGPYKETIEDGVTGVLVSDNRDWYDAVMELVNNDEKRNAILANAQKLVSEKYNIEHNYRCWKTAIDELIGAKA
jgi:glycosyltransferase involved in cell wall biosynthesis